MPSIPDWRDSVMAVKSLSGYRAEKPDIDNTPKISEEESAEVGEMLQDLISKYGGGFGGEGAFSSESVILRHGGVYHHLKQGLVQVYDGKNYAEWVPKGQENGRQVIDHTKSVEMIHTGRVSMKDYYAILEKNGGSENKCIQ